MVVCALDAQGLVAPLVLDEPLNGTAFVAWVAQVLVPELWAGDIVVIDNLSSHKVASVRQAFAKLKLLLRKTHAPTVEVLWTAIGALLDLFSPDACENYVRHAGYCKSMLVPIQN